MASLDKAAGLPKADVFLPRREPAAPPRPALYSIAVSLSGPPPPPPPAPAASTATNSTKGLPPPPPATPSILDPQHFPSLVRPASLQRPSSNGAWSTPDAASTAGGGALGLEGAGAAHPQQLQQQQATVSLPATSEPPDGDAQDHGGRHGPIQVEWLDLPSSRPERQSMSRQSSTSDATARPRSPSTPDGLAPPLSPARAPPTTGLLNLPAGSVHLYRHAPSDERHTAPAGSSSAGALSSSSIYTTAEVKMDVAHGDSAGAASTLLAVLAVPSYFSPADFLVYVQAMETDIECLRLIRDISPSRSIVLIQLRSSEAAAEFVKLFNGKPFNAFEPERCHVVPILHVLTHFTQPADPFATSRKAPADPAEPVASRPFPVVLGSERQSLALTESRLEEAFELPTCPVCLERMDSDVTGLVTVPCLHTYHCACLRKWGDSDSRCPVCRYSSKPLHLPPAPGSSSHGQPSPAAEAASAPSSCADCSTTEQLWICLICGNVGCGRYSDGKHAQAHYSTSGHLFALELDTQRCWNYAADEYVHRIVMDKSSGLLVELPSSSSSTTPSTPRFAPAEVAVEKLEAVALEYSHLLSSQLAAQRLHYEAHHASLEARIDQLEGQLGQSERERDRARIARLERDLRAEREMGQGLLRNLGEWRRKVDGAERDKEALRRQLADKDEELRDLMFFLEARDRIAEAEAAAPAAAAGASTDGGGGGAGAPAAGSVLGELQGGTVVLPPSTPGPGETTGAKKKKKPKKKSTAAAAASPAP